MKKGNKQTQITTQELVYRFLVKYIKDNGYSPSIREICIGTDLSSTSSVYNCLLKLEEERKIEVKHDSPRAIKLIGFELVKKESGINMEEKYIEKLYDLLERAEKEHDTNLMAALRWAIFILESRGK